MKDTSIEGKHNNSETRRESTSAEVLDGALHHSVPRPEFFTSGSLRITNSLGGDDSYSTYSQISPSG